MLCKVGFSTIVQHKIIFPFFITSIFYLNKNLPQQNFLSTPRRDRMSLGRMRSPILAEGGVAPCSLRPPPVVAKPSFIYYSQELYFYSLITFRPRNLIHCHPFRLGNSKSESDFPFYKIFVKNDKSPRHYLSRPKLGCY